MAEISKGGNYWHRQDRPDRCENALAVQAESRNVKEITLDDLPEFFENTALGPCPRCSWPSFVEIEDNNS